MKLLILCFGVTPGFVLTPDSSRMLAGDLTTVEINQQALKFCFLFVGFWCGGGGEGNTSNAQGDTPFRS